MRRVKCDNCGKVYDGDKRDFCPECGRRAPQEETGGNTGHFQFSTPPAQEPEASFPGPDMTIPSRRSGGALLLRVLIVIGLAVCAVLIAWGVVRYQSRDRGPIPSVAENTDTFAVGGLTVSVDGVSWVDLDRSSRLWWADFDLLAVDVTVTGGDSLDWDYPTGEIYLALDGGHYLPPLEDSTALEMLSELGMTAITTYDLLWQDPLEGKLLFYVPRGFDSATLCLEERTGRDEKERVEAIHTYSLTLPAREEAAP